MVPLASTCFLEHNNHIKIEIALNNLMQGAPLSVWDSLYQVVQDAGDLPFDVSGFMPFPSTSKKCRLEHPANDHLD